MTTQSTFAYIFACVLLSICILPSSVAGCPFAFRSASDSSETLTLPKKGQRLEDTTVRPVHVALPGKTEGVRQAAVRPVHVKLPGKNGEMRQATVRSARVELPGKSGELRQAAVRLSKYPVSWDTSKCRKKCLRKRSWKLVTENDGAEAPEFLRALFHDHQACALDGSLRFEMDRFENKGLKSASSKVVSTAYSCGCSIADTYALAAKFAVRVSGGPRIKMAWGHKDATEANPKGNMPRDRADAKTLRKVLYQYNDEAIALLSSAHNIGHGHRHSKNGTKVEAPFTTNERYFNNEYFKNLVYLHKHGKAPKGTFQLRSDRALIEDKRFLYIVKAYAQNDALYRYHFKLVMELIIGDFTECNNYNSGTIRLPALR